MIKNEEHLRISQKFMENLRIKVLVAEHWEQLPHTLEKIRCKGCHSRRHSSSGISELGLQDFLACNSKNKGKEVPLIRVMDGTENNNNNNILSLFKKTNFSGTSGFVLLVIDATAGPFLELCKIVNEFKSSLHKNSSNCNW